MKQLKMAVLFVLLAGLAVPVFAADITLQKGVNPATPNVYHPGETIHYVMRITNASATESIRIDTVVDTLPDGTVVPFNVPALPYTLLPGAFQNYTYDWVVPGDAQPGIVTNTLRATGVQFSTFNDPFDVQVTKTSLIVVPCVSVTKTVAPTTSKAGDWVTYTINVCNCGGPDISPVSVMDSILGDLSAFFVNTLATAECESHDFDYQIDANDPDPLVNVVTVDYNDSYGFPVDDNDVAEVDLVHPDFTITKDCLTQPVEPNSTAIFKVTITNIGDVNLVITTTEPEIPYIELAVGEVFVKDNISRQVGQEDVNNLISATATLPVELGLDNVIGPKSAEATCRIEQEGATRTLGFWKTHCAYTEHVFFEHCGGSMNLGWIQIYTIEDLLGVFYANNAQTSGGAKRDKICQARVIASKQAVAALLNDCLDNGATLPVTPGEIATILGSSNIKNIQALGALLDEYNNSGDDVAIIDLDGFMFSNATPRACKEIAHISAADCTVLQRKAALKAGR